MFDVVSNPPIDFEFFNISTVELRIDKMVLVLDCCSSDLDLDAAFYWPCNEEAKVNPKDTTSLNDDNFLALSNSSEITKDNDDGGFTAKLKAGEQKNKASHIDAVTVIPLPKI